MNRRPRLLDLFSGAGGAAMGYARAGFDVVGVDIVPQPHYPFAFVQADALTFPLEGFDVVHASPPCQAYTRLRSVAAANQLTEIDRPDLVAPVRERLLAWGGPYVIENVQGAPLVGAIMLCGTSFSLPLRRHRYFESNVYLLAPPCAHKALPIRYPSQHRARAASLRAAPRSRYVAVYGGTRFANDGALRKRAMEIEWMSNDELTQAIPPAYTETIGVQVRAVLEARVA